MNCTGVFIIASAASIYLCMHIHIHSMCGHTSMCSGPVCVHTHLCVSPWLQCECGILTEDTGTQSPAGEGDETQLGIIKPSTVSMKGPGRQVGPVSPRQSSLDRDWLHHSLPSLHSVPGSEERDKSDSDSAVDMCLDKNPENTAWLCCYFPKWTILCDATHPLSSPLICASQTVHELRHLKR